MKTWRGAACALLLLFATAAQAQILGAGRSNQTIPLTFRTTSATFPCVSNTQISLGDSATAKRATGATVKDTTRWISTACFQPIPAGFSQVVAVDSTTAFRVIWARYFAGTTTITQTDAAPTLTIQAAYSTALDGNCANLAQFSLTPNITMTAAGTGVYQTNITWTHAFGIGSVINGGWILPPFVRFIFAAAYSGEFEAWLHAPSVCGGGNVQ